MQENMDNRTQEKKKRKIALPILMVIVVVIAFVGGYFSSYLFKDRKLSVTNDLIRIIENCGYVFDEETGEKISFSEKDYANALVRGLLDDYAEYYTAEEYNEITKERVGSHKGIGLSIISNEKALYKVIGNSPADRAGLKKGDIITAGKIDQGAYRTISNGEELIAFFDECAEDAVITLKVTRTGEFTDREFVVQREVYVASYVTYYDSQVKMTFRSNGGKMEPFETSEGNALLDSDIGYIQLDEFEGGAGEQVKQAIDFMCARGRNKLIFDLRDNGGGYVDIMADIASALIYNNGAQKTLIATAEGKSDVQDFWTSENNFNQNVSAISVIANSRSASASEALIGAMLHYGDRFNIDRLVVEKNADGIAKTFGKGIMQTTYLLLSGGAFKLTTARILWPDRETCIHGKGIIALDKNAVDAGNDAILRAQQTLYE